MALRQGQFVSFGPIGYSRCGSKSVDENNGTSDTASSIIGCRNEPAVTIGSRSSHRPDPNGVAATVTAKESPQQRLEQFRRHKRNRSVKDWLDLLDALGWRVREASKEGYV